LKAVEAQEIKLKWVRAYVIRRTCG